MFKKLQDFIDDIKGQDKDVPSIEGANDQEFFEDDGCPSQPNNEEDKPSLFDELGGIPAPDSDDCDEEDKNEEEISSDKRCKKNFIEKFFQLQGFFQMMTMMNIFRNTPHIIC